MVGRKTRHLVASYKRLLVCKQQANVVFTKETWQQFATSVGLVFVNTLACGR